MRDEKGRKLDVFVVGGKVGGSTGGGTKVQLTLLLRTGNEVKKVDSYHTVYGSDQSVADPNGRNSEEFGERWGEVQDVIKRVLNGDRTVGKLFLREALEAYRARERLRPDQIASAMAGAFLVDPVERL
jgi:hypothetical protein